MGAAGGRLPFTGVRMPPKVPVQSEETALRLDPGANRATAQPTVAGKGANNVDNTLKPNEQAVGTGNKGTTPNNRTGTAGAAGTAAPKETTTAKSAAAGTIKPTIKLVEQDGSTYQFKIQGQNGELSVVADIVKNGNKLILNGMHIDGPGAGTSSLGELRDIVRTLGQQYGVDEVIIKGGTRTTGANPGKVPRTIIIKVNQ